MPTLSKDTGNEKYYIHNNCLATASIVSEFLFSVIDGGMLEI